MAAGIISAVVGIGTALYKGWYKIKKPVPRDTQKEPASIGGKSGGQFMKQKILPKLAEAAKDGNVAAIEALKNVKPANLPAGYNPSEPDKSKLSSNTTLLGMDMSKLLMIVAGGVGLIFVYNMFFKKGRR